MTRVVVTGGAGFLGSHLCERLVGDGCEVLCLDNFLTGSPDNVAHPLEHPRFRLVKADVTDHVHVPGPVDQVLHFASPASPVDYLQLPIETMKVGSVGTLHALGLAKEEGARFLLASTSESYGDPQVHPQPETYWDHVNPVGPSGVYDEAKRFAEALTMAYRRTHDVDTAIVRIFNTHGPRMRPDHGRAVPTFASQTLRGEPLTVAGDGSQTRSIIHVDGLVEGIVRLLRSDLPGPVDIGDPHEVSVLELARTVRRLIGSESEIVFVARPVDDPTVASARHPPGPHRARLGAADGVRAGPGAHARVVPGTPGGGLPRERPGLDRCWLQWGDRPRCDQELPRAGRAARPARARRTAPGRRHVRGRAPGR